MNDYFNMWYHDLWSGDEFIKGFRGNHRSRYGKHIGWSILNSQSSLFNPPASANTLKKNNNQKNPNMMRGNADEGELVAWHAINLYFTNTWYSANQLNSKRLPQNQKDNQAKSLSVVESTLSQIGSKLSEVLSSDVPQKVAEKVAQGMNEIFSEPLVEELGDKMSTLYKNSLKSHFRLLDISLMDDAFRISIDNTDGLRTFTNNGKNNNMVGSRSVLYRNRAVEGRLEIDHLVPFLREFYLSYLFTIGSHHAPQIYALGSMGEGSRPVLKVGLSNLTKISNKLVVGGEAAFEFANNHESINQSFQSRFLKDRLKNSFDFSDYLLSLGLKYRINPYLFLTSQVDTNGEAKFQLKTQFKDNNVFDLGNANFILSYMRCPFISNNMMDYYYNHYASNTRNVMAKTNSRVPDHLSLGLQYKTEIDLNFLSLGTTDTRIQLEGNTSGRISGILELRFNSNNDQSLYGLVNSAPSSFSLAIKAVNDLLNKTTYFGLEISTNFQFLKKNLLE